MGISDKLYRTMMPAINDAYLGTVVTHYAGGYANQVTKTLPTGVPRTVLLAMDAELGTNEMPGDGAVTRDQTGDRERRSGHIEVRKEVEITEDDLWLIDGRLWSTQREDGTDADPDGPYQGWRITYVEPRRTQHTQTYKNNRPVRRG